MTQRRVHSLAEVCLSVASGFVVSAIAWELIVKPVWRIETTVSENLQITAFFTLLSIARGYLWRRAGNWYATRRRT
jgi:hypothetical protein